MPAIGTRLNRLVDEDTEDLKTPEIPAAVFVACSNRSYLQVGKQWNRFTPEIPAAVFVAFSNRSYLQVGKQHNEKTPEIPTAVKSVSKLTARLDNPPRFLRWSKQSLVN